MVKFPQKRLYHMMLNIYPQNTFSCLTLTAIQGSGNNYPVLIPIHSGQVRKFNLLVLGYVTHKRYIHLFSF